MPRLLRIAVIASFVILSAAVPANAQLGAPVEGLTLPGGQAIFFVGWSGTATDPYHEAEVGPLGGFTLFVASAPGGPVLRSEQLRWPPSNPEQGAPGFIVAGLPDGVYWVLVVKGLTATPLAPPSAWIQKVVSRNPGAPCTAAPQQPTNLRAEVSNVNPVLTLRWDLSPSGCPAETVRIEAGYSPGATSAGVFDMLASSAWHGIAPAGTYYVRIRAGNSFGFSAPSNEIVVVIANQTCTGPGAPQGLTYTRVGNVVTLTWLPPSSPGSLPVAYYLIGGGTQPLVYPFTVMVPAAQLSFSTTLPPGTYYAVVAAGNGCGGSAQPTSLPSNEIQIIVP